AEERWYESKMLSKGGKRRKRNAQFDLSEETHNQVILALLAGCPLWPGWPRIVQCKMSTNLAVRPLRFPMQDEHESGKNEVGVARPGASTHVECREPQPRTDPRVSGRKRTDRVCGVWPGRKVRMGGGRAEGPGLWRVGQAGARRRPGVCGESYGNERVSGDAIDPWVSGSRDGAGHALPAASLRA